MGQGQKAVADRGEKAGRQHPVGDGAIVAAWQPPQIGARPDEFIPFRQDNPRPGIIELKPFLDPRRYLNGKAGMIGRRVRDWQHQHARIASLILPDRRDNSAGAVFLAFLATFQMFAVTRDSCSG